jgi:hypothetical protein
MQGALQRLSGRSRTLASAADAPLRSRQPPGSLFTMPPPPSLPDCGRFSPCRSLRSPFGLHEPAETRVVNIETR